jgi:hypothetical protein
MTHVPAQDLPQRIADEFSRLIRDALTPSQVADVLHRNEADLLSACVTSDFVNVRALMTQAFQNIMDRPDNLPFSTADEALWAAAWARAKDGQFPRRMELITNDEEETVYAYEIKETYISDPYCSECGRFLVDPIEGYGLRPAEVSALVNANARLRAMRSASGNPQRTVVTTLEGVRSRYLSMWESHIGGGAFALRLEYEGDSYLLITATGMPQVPADDATEVDISRHAKNGDCVEIAQRLPVAELQEWIDATLNRASSPQNIADYFVKVLGANHIDDSLLQLPIDSPCGIDCIAAIEATAALLKHVRAGYGTDREDLVARALQIARELIAVYWHG